MALAIFPHWLHALAIASLVIASACSVFIAADELRRPQHMAVMNLVWPVAALFGSVLWLWFYLRNGRAPMRRRQHGETPARPKPPMPVASAKAASHCGAGCMLGDIVGEWLVFSFAAVAIAGGWHWLFADKLFAAWVVDFVCAYVLGIAIQYFTIVPMKQLPPARGLIEALKADTASIAAWQVGMYACMAVIQFAWFTPAYGAIARANAPEFWFAMQGAMLCGFATSYPVNWLLLEAGVKVPM